MKPKRNGYLYSLAFEEGEFERSQALLEATLAPLASTLAASVGEALRSNLSKDIAEDWVSKANDVLKMMLSDASEGDEGVAQTISEMRHALSESPRLSDETIAAEIRACSEELAQLVLSHWFAELQTLTIPSDGIPLNANMLPGTRSIEAILDGLDFGAFGVTLPTVALAVRAYRDLLIGRANKGVIEFAPQLHIVLDPANSDHPFRCFSSESDARAKRVAATTASEMVLSREARKNRLVETIKAIRQATLPPETKAKVDLTTLANAVGSLMRETSFYPSRSNLQYSVIENCRTPQEDAERFLVQSVGLGVDIFSTGLSADLLEAKNLLSANSDSIRSLLFCYASARGVNTDAAADIYTVTVAAGVECQFGQIDADVVREMIDASAQDFGQVITNAYGVSSTTAEQLMRDSRTGMDYMAGPLMGEAWADKALELVAVQDECH